MALRTLLVSLMSLVALVSGACTRGSSPVPTATSVPLPMPVAVVTAPAQGFTLDDPAFDPLQSARVSYGRLGGSDYQIEIPDDWNGRLVLYLHGQGGAYRPNLYVERPGNRRELIADHFAWAASSFSEIQFGFVNAANETAALWDKFASEFGRPTKTYVIGGSAGGDSALFSAERYANRYDGVLALCPGTGTTSALDYLGDTFVAAAYAAGLTSDEINLGNVRQIASDTLVPALRSATTEARFVRLWTALSGGDRPFAAEGLQSFQEYLIDFGAKIISVGTYDNTDRKYALGLPDVSDQDFNARAVRIHSPNIEHNRRVFEDLTGRLDVPVLALFTSGDAIVPPSQSAYLRELVDTAGRGGKLVERNLKAAGHCPFTPDQIESALHDVVGWVEDGNQPAGIEP